PVPSETCFRKSPRSLFMFDSHSSAVEKRAAGSQRPHQRAKAAACFATAPIGRLARCRIANHHVAAHPIPIGVADEALSNALAFCQAMHQLERIGDRPVERLLACAVEYAAAIDRGPLPLGVQMLDVAKAAEVVERLERHSERI